MSCSYCSPANRCLWVRSPGEKNTHPNLRFVPFQGTSYYKMSKIFLQQRKQLYYTPHHLYTCHFSQRRTQFHRWNECWTWKTGQNSSCYRWGGRNCSGCLRRPRGRRACRNPYWRANPGVHGRWGIGTKFNNIILKCSSVSVWSGLSLSIPS